MKTFIKVLVVALTMILTAITLSAQSRYVVDHYDGRVYYERHEVYGADATSFRDLGYDYGKDLYHVYYYGEVLEYVDPSTFRVSRRFASRPDYNRPDRPHRPGHPYPGRPDYPGHGHQPPIFGGSHVYYDYYVRGGSVFYGDKRISDAHARTFQPLTCGYAKDAFRVYWAGKRVKDANVHTFKVLGWGYAKDAFRVYWHGKAIAGVSVNSFRVLENGYAEDAFNSYREGRKFSADECDDDDEDDD